MKKTLFKKILTSTATIFAVAAVAVPNVSVFAVDTPTINASPATKLDTPADTTNVTVNKDIVLFNVDGSDILSPNVTYSYEITPATVPNASITTNDSDGNPVTIKVKRGVIGAVSATSDDLATTSKVEGTITFGDSTDSTNNNTNTHSTNKESVTSVDLAKKVSSSMTISVNANKIYDPQYGETGHTNTQVNGPGVYRYKIEDVTTDAALTDAGITRSYKDATNDHDKYIYLDVYTKYNAAKNGLEIYGYVLLKDTDGHGDVSLNYDTTVTNETIKITGFDTDSENTDKYGDGTVDKANLTSDAYHTYNVEVSKKTAGDLADTQHNFPFKVELTNSTVTSSDDFYYQITKDGTALSAVNVKLPASGSWILDGTATSPANDLRLQNGDKIVITGLPEGTSIKVTEKNDTNDKYTVSAKDTNNTALSLNNSTSPVSVNAGAAAAMDTAFVVSNTTAGDKIEFTNTLKDISVTGLLFSIAPFVFITIAGVVLLVLVLRNKKNSDSKNKI